MNNVWPNIDNLQFEKLGMSRNALILTVVVAFALYQLIDFLARPSLAHMTGILKLSPLLGSAALWWFFIVPQTRNLLDTLPKGYFQGLSDYYLTNPGSLEIANDPEPMPLYLPEQYTKTKN